MTHKTEGPGTILKRMIPGILKRRNCGCGDIAKQMDTWGVSGCERNKKHIVRHLVNQARQNRLLRLFGERPARIVAEHWVSQAIERARSG